MPDFSASKSKTGVTNHNAFIIFLLEELNIQDINITIWRITITVYTGL